MAEYYDVYDGNRELKGKLTERVDRSVRNRCNMFGMNLLDN